MMTAADVAQQLRKPPLQTLPSKSNGQLMHEDIRLTDLGNCTRLVNEYGDRFRYANGLGFLIWDGRRFTPDLTGQVYRFAKDVARAMLAEASELEDDKAREKLVKWALTSQSEQRLSAMVKLARTEERIAIAASALDADPWAFNVKNGTIDLRTGELRQHDPSKLITKLAPVNFDPAATSPRFARFLDEILDGNDALSSYLQRTLGAAMAAVIREHVIQIFGSSPNSGA